MISSSLFLDYITHESMFHSQKNLIFHLFLSLLNFLNCRFTPSVQSQDHFYGGDRMKGWPCYETGPIAKSIEEIFVKTFEKKNRH